MRNFKILLAEDDSVIAELIEVALSRFNFSVRHAIDGRMALKYLSDETFDLMLCDIMMPYLDGLKLLAEAHAHHTPLPPVIMLSALHDQESVMKAKRLGAIGYLAKPITPDQLLNKVKNALAISEKDIIDKQSMAFEIGTGHANRELILSLIGCPLKSPQGDLIKAVSRITSSNGPFRSAQIQVGADFAYAAEAIDYLKNLAIYLQRTYSIPKNSIRFAGPFWGIVEKDVIDLFRQYYTVD